MTSPLRETAQEIFDAWLKQSTPKHEDVRTDMVLRMTEALEAAYKQGALARVTGPSDEAAHEFIEATLDGHDADNEEIASSGQALIGWCLNSLKITPLTSSDLVPNHNFFWAIHDKLKHGLSYHPGTASVVYDETCIYLRDFVAAKLEGK